MKNYLKSIVLILMLCFVSCAKRGSITGGSKDTLAPVLKMGFPKNYTTNFKGNEIKLIFDEIIKLKDLNKQLVVSPPMKGELEILPTTPTKTITIKIKDTLQPNTTYNINFGQSIADNNEGNSFNQFKYVFSTGNFVDSLTLNGTINDAYNKEIEHFVSVMLYEATSTLSDSIVYNKTPRYITNTLDSLSTFKLENLKAGKYMLVALKDDNKNNKFNPRKEKIGFRKHYITVPNDSIFELKLFKEVLPFKAYKPIQASGNKMLLGYDGKVNSTYLKPKIVLKKKGEILTSIITQYPKKDSLQIWFKALKTDSLAIEVNNQKYTAKFALKIKDQKKDTLAVTSKQSGNLNFRERFTLETKTPLVRFDNSKIKLINTTKKGLSMPFTTEYDEFNQQLFFDFKKEPSEEYTFKILPGALTDFFEKSNDTLSFKISTKALEEYGNLSVNLQNVKQFPVLVQLTDSKGDVVATEYSDKNTRVNFNLLDPALYSLRVIYDTNKNKEWDSGNYIEKRQAEEIIYFSKEIDVRSNWDVEQVFDLSIPYVLEKKEKPSKKKNKL